MILARRLWSIRRYVPVAALGAVLALPFVLRPPSAAVPADAVPLVIISPHNEAIRYEFGRAFSAWHQQRYGRPVAVDWRTTGGTSEIARYLSSQYAAVFRRAWTRAGRAWTATVAGAFDNPKVSPDDPAHPAEAREARAAFLASNAGIGIDLFFGGGEYDHSKHAAMGYTVDSGYMASPEGAATLGAQIPQQMGGENWYDPQGRWFGATLSSFGICYNRDVVARRAGAWTPATWRDLGRPELFGQVALADPTKSGSINKAFEMVLQQEMARAVAETPDDAAGALARGWRDGLNVVRQAAANARYFTDSALRIPQDVAAGNAAAGMCIDFYGMIQAEAVAKASGRERMAYVSPVGGTTVGCDPIAMLRGAPNAETALRFITFVLSLEGQKLWGLRAGAPGGPVRYSLHRPPIRRDFYTVENLRHANHPELDPYALAETFTYRAAWTARLFGGFRLLIRVMCMDTGEELRAAWRAVLDSGGPEAQPAAMAALFALPANAEYDALPATLAATKTKLDEARLAREWSGFFSAQYRLARALAQRQEESDGAALQESETRRKPL